MRTRWPSAQEPQPAGVEGRGVVGQLGAVVEQDRAGPGGRVEAAHRRLHGDRTYPAAPSRRPRPRCGAGRCSGRPASSPGTPEAPGRCRVEVGGGVDVATSDGKRGRVDLVGAASRRAGAAEPGPNIGREVAAGRASSSVVPVPSASRTKAAPVPRAARRAAVSSAGRSAGRSAASAPDARCRDAPGRERGAVGERRVEPRVRCVGGHVRAERGQRRGRLGLVGHHLRPRATSGQASAAAAVSSANARASRARSVRRTAVPAGSWQRPGA